MEHLIRSMQDDVKEVREDVKDLAAEVKKIAWNGCAKREGDQTIIRTVESNQHEFRKDVKEFREEMKKLVITSVGSLLTLLLLTVAFLLKYVLFR